MLDRILSVLVALSLAFLVWLYARSRDQEVLDNVPVPVHVNLARGQADDYSLEVPEPCQVPVSFSGPPSRIHELRTMLQRGELSVEVTLTIPEEHRGESHYIENVRIDAAEIHAPPGVTPMLVEGRNRVPVALHHLVEQRLPVRFDYAGDDRVERVRIEPAKVLVRGPEEVLDRLRDLPTQPYQFPARPDAPTAPQPLTLGPVPLVQEIDGRPVHVTPPAVAVRLVLQPRKQVYDLDLPIHFLCPANFALQPRFTGDGHDAHVQVSVEGPAGNEPPAVFALIDLTRHRFEQGLHHEPLRLQLPGDCRAVDDTPRLVPFRLDPPEPTVKGVFNEPGQ
jgi:hypothetical protein